MTQPSQSKQPDPVDLFKKYKSLLWDKKFWILSIMIVISLFWLIISPYVFKAEYSASVTIKFDDPRLSRGISAVTDFAQAERTIGKVALLHTNAVMTKVVDTLQLNVRIVTSGIPRFSLFKKIDIINNQNYGDYKLLLDEKKLNLYYTNNERNIENKLLHSQIFNVDTNYIELNNDGMNLQLSTLPILQFKEIEFKYINKRISVESLKKRIERNLDRSHTVLKITYSDKDPEVASTVINTTANIYIDQLLNFKKYRTTSVIKSLKDQLSVAQKELDASEEKLKVFREQNPFLMLSRESTDIITRLSEHETDLSSQERSNENLLYLIDKRDNCTGESCDLIYAEILSSISSSSEAGQQVMLDQYNAILSEKNRLINENYSEQHMLVKDVNTRLKKMQEEIDERVNQFLSQTQGQIQQLKNTIYTSKRNIRGLPASELRLAELERDRLVKSNIYSSILVKYNEAKVSDASVISDAFIIEEAQVPIVASSFVLDLLKIIIGPILGFFVAIGFFIILNIFDRSVKNVSEIESKLDIPVLATIPVILDTKDIPDDIIHNGEMDPKLITSSYSPSIANEKFRLLRTKLVMNNEDNRTFLLTSLQANDGKSLVAANMAITFAQQKNSTLLIDGDIRRGVLHNTFNCKKKPGLVDLLARNKPLTDSEISDIVKSTQIPNLFILPSGMQAPNPSELLGNPRMEQLFNLLKKKFSVIIVDTPPIQVIPDAFILNSLIHNILFVVRYGKTNLNKVHEKIVEYSNIVSDFRGVIINASEEVEHEKYSSYSYYHY